MTGFDSGKPLVPWLLVCLAGVILSAALLTGCQPGMQTPTPTTTPTALAQTPTPRPPATPTPAEQPLFHTYAYGELLPDMRTPRQRSMTGEGGWYLLIGSQEGWTQFLSQMGQPAQVWQEIEWEQEILIGALLGLREGRQHRITITDLLLDGIQVQTTIAITTPAPDSDSDSAPWITYPFHFIRVPRIELPLGPAAFRFIDEQGHELGNHVIDASNIEIVWLPGASAAYPTPTPVLATATPEPTPTSTPVPNLHVLGVILDINPQDQALRIIPATGDWDVVKLMEGTSLLLDDGQPTTLSQLEPGVTINVLGYAGEENAIRAAHIEVLKAPPQDPTFAAYTPRSVAMTTIYDGYTPPLSLDRVIAPAMISETLSISQTELLTKNGLVVVPAQYDNLAALYNDPQYSDYPMFISTDSVLHISQLLFAHTWAAVEQKHLFTELTLLDHEMFAHAWAQYESAKISNSTTILAAAQQNAAYFAVALSLLDPSFTPPAAISTVVHAELSLITATQGITISPLFNNPTITDAAQLRIDYTAFGADQNRYAQAMTWHRAAVWRLDQPPELVAAILILNTLNNHSTPRILWQRINAPLTFFDGQPLISTPVDYLPLFAQVWGQQPEPEALIDEAKLIEFVQAVRDMPPPGNRFQVWATRTTEFSPTFGFFGTPFQADRYILQRTANITATIGNTATRRPVAINLAAAQNSPEAYNIAAQAGADIYTDDFDQIRVELDALPEDEWTATLPWNWLYTYRLLVQDKNLSFPPWMRTKAWRRRELQTMLGHWIDTQRSVPLAGPTIQRTQDAAAPWGYVEPQPQVYGHLAALTQAIIDGLNNRLMLDDAEKETLSEWHAWLILLQDVARRELTGQTLTDLDYQRLTDYGTLVASLTATTAMPQPGETAPSNGLPGYTTAHAVEIASVANTQTIGAIGGIDEIYVVVERGQQQYLARGGVYSYYEFENPAAQPWDDTQWQQRLAQDPPPRPAWMVGEFVVSE